MYYGVLWERIVLFHHACGFVKGSVRGCLSKGTERTLKLEIQKYTGFNHRKRREGVVTGKLVAFAGT